MRTDLVGSLLCLSVLSSALGGHFDDGDLGLAEMRVELAQQRGCGAVVNVVRRETWH